MPEKDQSDTEIYELNELSKILNAYSGSRNHQYSLFKQCRGDFVISVEGESVDIVLLDLPKAITEVRKVLVKHLDRLRASVDFIEQLKYDPEEGRRE